MYDDPSFIYYDAAKNNKVGSVVKFLTNTSPANIYPTLKIGSGEKKIIINVLFERKNSSEYGNTSDKVALGLRFVDPPMLKNGQWSYMFQSVVIFTPKQGLFDLENYPS